MTLLESNFLPLFKGTFLYTVLGLVAIAIIVTVILYFRAQRMKRIYGVMEEPKKEFAWTFWIMLIAAGLAVFLIKEGLEGGVGMLNTLFFAAFPYITVAIFILGSIYRYRNTGFKVSSLSTQFLEGKQLFWGSQPFHWGILFLFVGHLVAFLFPRSVIGWNGEPVRLLILEISSFVFALSALYGLIVLIYRRLGTRRISMVTNKMDMLVYVVLFTQITSGLGIALFARWGSTWFASTLTPYLRSIFAFNPDIAAVTAMPWFVQVHIISAFFIIAVIPFSRFMHFLVAPIDYIWRNYQVVVWNYNRKLIRKSTRHTFGRKIKNH
ncbi:MAG: respiratory nitrate reductase subunit gamma [Crocinitomicaceae bacterium]|nr:respiratory nitrate reductase subunit gamma [Crocinitomicaceae bacterium]|tara:strand:- start:20764 stop:21732 length:969 start_codon:yes stop_codon:yes gene_type:complete